MTASTTEPQPEGVFGYGRGTPDSLFEAPRDRALRQLALHKLMHRLIIAFYRVEVKGLRILGNFRFL